MDAAPVDAKCDSSELPSSFELFSDSAQRLVKHIVNVKKESAKNRIGQPALVFD